jgi:hypothetical protein
MSTTKKDALWRRLLIGLGLYLQCRADVWFPGDPETGITWQDRARWRVEDIGMHIFCLGHDGSLAEHEMILSGDLELSDLTIQQQEKYLPLLSPFVITEDLRYCLIRQGSELLELLDHAGHDHLDEDVAADIDVHLVRARAELMRAAELITRELTDESEPLLLEDGRAV